MKKDGRGFYLHGFNAKCFNCCCSVCTGRACPYPEHYGVYQNRCARCVRLGGLRVVLDCDYFENKHTSRRRFKIKSRVRKPDPVLEKLNAILEKLDVGKDD